MVQVGSKYKLIKHPYHPVGTATMQANDSKRVLITWDDQGLIPHADWYDEQMFGDGTFELLKEDPQFKITEGNGNSCQMHEWAHYVGLNSEYDYCKNCDRKRAVK
jgi:hypothetical protein